MSSSLRNTLLENLRCAEIGWSIGIFGAVAEFHRDADEPAALFEMSVATSRGAIRLSAIEECRPVPFEPRSHKQRDRNFGVALCLPETAARMQYREVLTELGRDADAIDASDRGAILFDLGLGSPYGVFCVRSDKDTQIEILRKGVGRPLLGTALFDEIACMSPHRVFMSRLGRIEVYQPIAPVGGKTPEGPHTHLLPKLVSRKRTHNANALLPAGLVPCATFYPEKGGHA